MHISDQLSTLRGFICLIFIIRPGTVEPYKQMERKQERHSRIIRTLQINQAASIRDLARELGVSDITIRRDLRELARAHTVRLMPAGAVLSPELQASAEQPRYSLNEAGATRLEEKRRIGARAASLIEENDIVIVDSGSTTECLVRDLPPERPITLLCFALNILVEAHRRPECRVIAAGGTLHENTLMLESPEGVQLIRRFRAHKAFISAAGIHEKLGVTCANDYEVEMKKAALASSLTRILVADSSKFGRVRAAHFAELSDFDMVITDSGLPDEVLEGLRAMGIACHRV